MERVLFIFKDKPWYINHIKMKFSQHFEQKYFFISNKINLSREEIIFLINKIINKNKIKKVFFDIDYTSYINKNFVSKINSKYKIAFSFDTEENIIKINKSIGAFSHFLTAEPKLVKKFEKKLKCFFFPLETSEKYFKKMNIKKKYDIFFFGELKADRKLYINELNKLRIRKKILINTKNKISDTKLNKIINKSKITINFSKGINKNSNKFYDQFKGRIITSGLSGTFCLSEKYLSSKILFQKNFPSFSNEKDMIKKINLLIKKKNYLNNITGLFVKDCIKFSDKIYIKKVLNFLNQKNNFKKYVLDFDEAKDLIKISSRKNNLQIYLTNLNNILLDLNKKNKNNILNISLLAIFGIIYFFKNLMKLK